MKKSILILGCSLMTIHAFSQSDISGPFFGHQRTNARYVGWSPGLGSVAGPLDIRNDFNEPINLYTNGIQNLSTYAVFSCYYTPPKTSTLAN
jgi:hypothetical protein